MALAKATIAELVGNDQTRNELDVQFNPASLRLQITNQIEGGKAPGRQVRQYIGSNSTTLTLDLVFDTADEGTTGNPRSVRERTDTVERFLRPQGQEGKKYVVPRIRFHWDQLIFDGIVDTLTLDLDHFAANGTPLRAKVSLAIKQQNRPEELLQTGPGANAGAPPQAPGQAGAGGLGSSGGPGLGTSPNASPALAGESAPEFSARAGLDPAAWRGLDLGGEDALSLSAGASIGFSLDLNASAGLGITLGAEAGVSASLEASFGLSADASLTAVGGVGGGAGLAAGFALSAAGGVSAALASVQGAKNATAEQQTRDAFQTPPPAPATAVSPRSQAAEPQPTAPSQDRTPLRASGFPSPSAQAAAPSAPPLPAADPRSSSYGFGAPLRETFGTAAAQRSQAVYGSVELRPTMDTGEPPTTNDPTTPAWVALPARDLTRNQIERNQQAAAPACACSCAP